MTTMAEQRSDDLVKVVASLLLADSRLYGATRIPPTTAILVARKALGDVEQVLQIEQALQKENT